MLQANWEDKKAIIDLRERILNGEHPRHKVYDFVKSSPEETIFEIHVPRPARPLRDGLEEMGFKVSFDELDEEHFMITAQKN